MESFFLGGEMCVKESKLFRNSAGVTGVVVGFHLPQQCWLRKKNLKGSEGETHMMNIPHERGWNEWEDTACAVGVDGSKSVLS